MNKLNNEVECFEEVLIINVQLYKCLYNKFDSGYHDKIKREKAWLEVSEKSGKTVKDCQTRWRTLRERFSREMRKMEMPSGSGACSQETWAWFNNMLFLKEFIQLKRTINNDNEILIPDETETPSVGPPSKKKRNAYDEICEKFMAKLDNLDEQDSTDDLFMKTIISLIKDLPVHAKDKARSEIMSIVMELRAKYTH